MQAGRRSGRSKQPPRPLSRARVLDAALGLADAEGLAAVTMRRLASDLGVEAMSLYHHLPGKEGLLDGLVERLIAEIESTIAEAEAEVEAEPAAGAGAGAAAEPGTLDWRAAVRRRCLTARGVMVGHPWAPALITSRPTVPPAAYAYYEEHVATMVRGGLSYRLAHRALHALGSMLLGFAQEVFNPEPDDARADAEQAEADFARMSEVLPHLTAMVASEIHQNDENVLGWCDSQTEFEFTLDLLLDGLARAAEAES